MLVEMCIRDSLHPGFRIARRTQRNGNRTRRLRGGKHLAERVVALWEKGCLLYTSRCV